MFFYYYCCWLHIYLNEEYNFSLPWSRDWLFHSTSLQLFTFQDPNLNKNIEKNEEVNNQSVESGEL
jgi:hypothetical protein